MVSFLNAFIIYFFFLAVTSIGILVCIVFNEKMESSITMMTFIVAMFILDSVSKVIPDYENLDFISLKHFYNFYEVLKFGEIDFAGTIVLVAVTIQSLFIAMIYF